MKKILLFLLIIFLIPGNNLQAKNKSKKKFIGCDSGISENYLKNYSKIKIKKIEVVSSNYRKWTVNSIKILKSNTRYIDDIYKKRFKASIEITYIDNSKCTYTGKIRHSGDQKDHISFHGNSIIQSIDVHLDNGNIRGFTKFKLLKPNTRGVLEDVIIQNQLLKNLGYLAPRTIIVNAKINTAESIMILQEKASKELLEYNNRREGPILEANEKYFWQALKSIPDNQLSNWSAGVVPIMNRAAKHMLAKQTNTNLISKNKNYRNMSYDVLTNLNLVYLYYSSRFQDKKNNYNHFEYDLDNQLLALFKDKNIIILDVYNLLLQSTNSYHGLGANNRKFYWNSFENYFEPIHYDANPNINSDPPNNYYRMPISNLFFESFELLKNKIKNLDRSKFKEDLVLGGLYLTKKEIDFKLDKISQNLDKIENNYINYAKKESIEHNKFTQIDNVLGEFNKALSEVDPNIYLVKYNESNDTLQRCEIYLKSCEDFNLSDKSLAKLLEGELVINQRRYQYLGKNLDVKNIGNIRNYKKLKYKNSEIFFETGIKIDFNLEKNILNITQDRPGARLYIKGGKLNDLIINFNGYNLKKNENSNNIESFPQNYPMNNTGLTGCLSFINLKVKNITVIANKSTCEDAVNFINVEGTINKILIDDSFSDGLDIDFSNLQINKIKISSSMNDCVDFSAGEYLLNSLELKNCGDKALSVGEKSFVKLDNIIASNSNIGIASKDSSIVNLGVANLDNLETCVSAYGKKPEFNGAIIKMSKMICKNYFRKADIDARSKIYEKNINLKNNDYGTTYDPFKLKFSKVKGEVVTKNYLKDYKTFNDDKSINAVIEIPAGVKEKWKVSKIKGSLNREFYMGKPKSIEYQPYPVNFGIIPNTVVPAGIGGSGDPLDIIILGSPLAQGDVVKVKIIGLIKMSDFGEKNNKIVAVPIKSDLSDFENLLHLKSRNPLMIEKIKVWFEKYKGENIVKFENFGTPQDAKKLITIANKQYKKTGIKPRS